MAKLTLLEVVQSVMNSMDEQLVSTISDTEISEQIALEAQNVYFDLMQAHDWPHLNALRQLDSLSSTARPNYLVVPSDLTEIHNIRYDVKSSTDTQPKWKDIHYKTPEDFLRYVQNNDPSLATVQEVQGFDSVPTYIYNNKAPSYWTSFDDTHIVFDSFDNSVDSTLQQSKSSCLAKREPTWTTSGDFIPDMPSKLFPGYLSELKRKCFVYFKDVQSPEDIRTGFRAMAVQKHKASQTNGKRKLNYGRK